MDFAGEFETHLTVAGHAADLREWAGRHGMKYLRIELDRGDHPSQPMLTRRASGTLAGELQATADVRRRLHDAGHSVVRTKIEAAPGNADVPTTDADAEALPKGLYFEHHVKLLLDPAFADEMLTGRTEHLAARLSRNALKVRPDGFRERFLTQRCSGVGRANARRQLDQLLAEVARLRLDVLKVEEEFVVYDSNLGLDHGWID